MEGFDGFQKYFRGGGGCGEPTFVFGFVLVLAHEQPIIVPGGEYVLGLVVYQG